MPASTQQPTTGGNTSAESLIRDAHVILTNCGHPMGPSKVSRLVRQFQYRVERNGFAFFEFLANAVQLDAETRRRALANADVQRVISHADPTGEAVASNVDRGLTSLGSLADRLARAGGAR